MSDFIAHLIIFMLYSVITGILYTIFGFEITVLFWLITIDINIINHKKE